MSPTPKISLSLVGLPSFDTSPFFCSLDSDIEPPLGQFVGTHERARVGLRFLLNVGAPADHMHVTPDEEAMMHSGYLRAALMEFVGMEEALPGDLRLLGIKQAPLRLYDTGNAMLILLRELRHLHVHVAGRKLLDSERAAIARGLGKEIETTLTIQTIPRADLDLLLDPRQAQKCQLKAAIEWLDAAQNRWGIQDVVQSGVNAYARLIVTQFGGSAQP